jgi:hypothetical protein
MVKKDEGTTFGSQIIYPNYLFGINLTLLMTSTGLHLRLKNYTYFKFDLRIGRCNKWKRYKLRMFRLPMTFEVLMAHICQDEGVKAGPASPLSFLQDILPILWTRGPGQMVMVTDWIS